MRGGGTDSGMGEFGGRGGGRGGVGRGGGRGELKEQGRAQNSLSPIRRASYEIALPKML